MLFYSLTRCINLVIFMSVLFFTCFGVIFEHKSDWQTLSTTDGKRNSSESTHLAQISVELLFLDTY